MTHNTRYCTLATAHPMTATTLATTAHMEILNTEVHRAVRKWVWVPTLALELRGLDLLAHAAQAARLVPLVVEDRVH